MSESVKAAPKRRLAVGDVSKDRRMWANVKQAAQTRLAGMGGELRDSPNDYEVMRWNHPDLTLVFYPHRTTAGNHHIRVRAQHCKSRILLEKVIFALAENSCQFGFPSEPEIHSRATYAAVKEKRSFTQ